jgi:hypothetical protein
MSLSLRRKKRGEGGSVKLKKNASVRNFCQQPGQFASKFDLIKKQQPEVVGSITSFYFHYRDGFTSGGLYEIQIFAQRKLIIAV